MTPDSFTIRVYGLLIHEGRILLSRENIHGDIYTKFPGGGLEFGEGVLDCLRREFMEEVSIEISEPELFYVNENFLASAFHNAKQVVVIYYLVKSTQVEEVQSGNPDHELLLKEDEDQILYWCKLEDLVHEPIELPVDREVVQKLLRNSNALGDIG